MPVALPPYISRKGSSNTQSIPFFDEEMTTSLSFPLLGFAFGEGCGSWVCTTVGSLWGQLYDPYLQLQLTQQAPNPAHGRRSP